MSAQRTKEDARDDIELLEYEDQVYDLYTTARKYL